MIFWVFWLVCPIFAIGKFVQILLPYLIMGYICYYNYWNEIDLFPLVMLFVYIILQIFVFILGVIVIRIHYWMWHLRVGDSRITFFSNDDIGAVVTVAKNWYSHRVYLPLIKQFIIDMFGMDIGRIIMNYYENIRIDNKQELLTIYKGII